MRQQPVSSAPGSGQPVQSGQPSQGGQPTQSGQPSQGGQPTQSGQPVRVSGAMPQLSLPERAVIVQTGIINDTFVEILSGLEEGQIVELAGSAATSQAGYMGNQMFMGPGPSTSGVMVTTRDGAPSPR